GSWICRPLRSRLSLTATFFPYTTLFRSYAMSEYDAGVLSMTRALAEFFDEAAGRSGHPKAAANWIMGDLLKFFKDRNVDLKDLRSEEHTSELQSLTNLVCRLLLEKKKHV